MASPVAKTVAQEIFDILNPVRNKGSLIPEFQLQQLIRKAESLSPPEKYVCLTAIYSNKLDIQKSFESAVKCLECYNLEQSDIENTVSALCNAYFFSKAIDLSKRFPEILGYSKVLYDVYTAALYTFDLKYCALLVSEHPTVEDNYFLQHKDNLEYLNNDWELIKRASDYHIYVFDSLIEVLTTHSSSSYSIALTSGVSEENQPLELRINIMDQSFEKVIDMECDWIRKISQHKILDNKLCDISFSMGIKH
jgi:hypothetical protein